jgi:2,3-bisphosphoglycerate-independent phosphoglycerate mutase
MDRDHRWPRIQAAYDLITLGKAEFQAPDAMSALQMAYARDESDEFVKATAIVPDGGRPVTVEDGDVIVFMNFRSDRARQITRPFIEPEFDGFVRQCIPRLGCFVSLTEYKSDFDVPVAYPAERLKNVFGDYVAKNGLRQLRLAETEKYAHVTFFFNGGREKPFEGEDRILVKSPMVPTYDMQPEMSAPEVTDKLIAAIEGGTYDVIICNFANPDMVGHTGKFDAAVKAIEAIDMCLGRIVEAVDRYGGEILVTADHGNAELMLDNHSGQPHTAHTTNLVPLVYIGRPARLQENGALSDIAPTMLALMDMPIPPDMTGTPLVELQSELEDASEVESVADVHG